MRKQITLAMDSSGQTLLVGTRIGEKIYTLRQTGIKQEQFFLPLLERVLAKTGANINDIGKVFFVRGPGRFTGIRISLTFASMMQSLNGSKVGSATSFEILYEQVQNSLHFVKWKEENKQGVVAVVLHAFREEYFLQYFDEEKVGPQWLSKGELLQKLAAYKRPLYITGTDKDNTALVNLLGDKYHLAPLADGRVRIETLLAMAENPIYEKNALEPLYLKPARFELGK